MTCSRTRPVNHVIVATTLPLDLSDQLTAPPAANPVRLARQIWTSTRALPATLVTSVRTPICTSRFALTAQAATTTTTATHRLSASDVQMVRSAKRQPRAALHALLVKLIWTQTLLRSALRATMATTPRRESQLAAPALPAVRTRTWTPAHPAMSATPATTRQALPIRLVDRSYPRCSAMHAQPARTTTMPTPRLRALHASTASILQRRRYAARTALPDGLTLIQIHRRLAQLAPAARTRTFG